MRTSNSTLLGGAVATVALALCLAVVPARADDDDHEAARAALQRGEIRPLGDILAVVAREAPGDVIEVDLDRDHGRWEYEVKVLTAGGRVLEIEIDAHTGEVRQIEDD